MRSNYLHHLITFYLFSSYLLIRKPFIYFIRHNFCLIRFFSPLEVRIFFLPVLSSTSRPRLFLLYHCSLFNVCYLYLQTNLTVPFSLFAVLSTFWLLTTNLKRSDMGNRLFFFLNNRYPKYIVDWLGLAVVLLYINGLDSIHCSRIVLSVSCFCSHLIFYEAFIC